VLGKSLKLKLIIIPALAGVLGFILIRDSSKESVSEPLIPTKQQILVSTRKQVVWPEFELEEIALLQPYKTLKQLDQIQSDAGVASEEATNAARQAESLRNALEVRAIFQTPQGASALVGDRVVRAGDVLPDGKRVTAIRADGVEVADR
jgi:hypothetical protein